MAMVWPKSTDAASRGWTEPIVSGTSLIDGNGIPAHSDPSTHTMTTSTPALTASQNSAQQSLFSKNGGERKMMSLLAF